MVHAAKTRPKMEAAGTQLLLHLFKGELAPAEGDCVSEARTAFEKTLTQFA